MHLQDPNHARTATAGPGQSSPAPPPKAAAFSPGILPAELPSGHIVSGRYQVLSVLGQGGMGVVYRARTAQGFEVALKTLQGVLGDAQDEPSKRFWREARATSAIQHPNVVRLLDAGTDEDLPYLVMELLDGKDLASAIKREGPLDPALTARIFVQACHGLAALHARQIIHRDIKPSNLFLHRDPCGLLVAKICDLGIAKHDPASGGASTELTHTGGILGSPAYMSPEQVQDSKRVDHRSDLWSLCASLYEALCGRKCWAGCSNVGELFVAICTREVPPLAEQAPWLDRKLCEVIHRGLRQDREARYASATELAAALEPFAAPDSALLVPRLDALGDTPLMAEVRRAGLPAAARLSGATASTAATRADTRTAAPAKRRLWIAAPLVFAALGAVALAFLGKGWLGADSSARKDAVVEAPRNVAEGGLALGSHGCMMIDGTGSYNRVCTVQQEGGGPLKVRAPGTSLNPTIGFEFAATGGPETYETQGKMRAFDGCTGPFSARTVMQSAAGIDWYVVKFKHCKIMVRKDRLLPRAPALRAGGGERRWPRGPLISTPALRAGGGVRRREPCEPARARWPRGSCGGPPRRRPSARP